LLARYGAMKLHQSACAPLPCRSKRPGAPSRPQTRVSILAPRTSRKRRSGACASALSNHSGAGGLLPLRGVRGPGARSGLVFVAGSDICYVRSL
jgi:hypothetical protein